MSDKAKFVPDEAAAPAEEFIAVISGQLETEITERLSDPCLDLFDDEIAAYTVRALEIEKTFCREVVSSYGRWALETSPLVLWDVDNTLGKHISVTAADPSKITYAWKFRPALVPLLTYLRERFPQVRNGLISNRAQLEEQLADPKYLAPVQSFFDATHLYSCSEVQPSQEVELYFKALDVLPDGDHKKKLTILRNLQAAGVNVKVIDDNQVAKTLGEDGLYTYSLVPRT